jgi:Glycosyltransferase like family
MIVFGCAITKREVYRRCAEPGLRRALEPDSKLLALPAVGSIFASYNALLDRAAAADGLDALVLVHQDTEITDADFAQKAREALRDPDVGVVGCVGAVGVRSIAWWEGSVALASFIHRYEEHGGGDLPSFSWAWEEAPPYARLGEVDTVDGFLLVLSPWTVRNVRFDESLGRFHGYDFDFCLQVREAGRRVVTADFRAIHHHSLDLVSEPESWIEAHIRVAEKWDGRMPGVGWAPGTWKERARRAEAEHEAALVKAYANGLEADARVLHLERALSEARESISWRITAPLRRLAGLRLAGRRRSDTLVCDLPSPRPAGGPGGGTE